MLQNFVGAVLRHKIISLIIIALIVVGGYYSYKKITAVPNEIRYVLAAVEKGTFIFSVSGSGQVSVSNQVDVKAKASGDVIYVGVKIGQEVKSGALISQLNSRDAQKSVRDAEAALEGAKISLVKLQQPSDKLSVMQAENGLTDAGQAKEKAKNDLSKAYDDAFTSISNAFIDLPVVISGVQDILYKNNNNPNQDNTSYYKNLVQNYDTNADKYGDSAVSSYQSARKDYDKNFQDYKNTSRYASNNEIEAILNETYDATKSMAEAVKNSDNFLSFVKDQLITHSNILPSLLTTQQSSLSSYTDKVNSNLVSLLDSISSIKNYKDTIADSDLTIEEKTEALANIKAGADPLDIESSKLSIKQKENSLMDAKEKYADYYSRAPFDGIIAAVGVKKGDSISSGAVVATLITKQKLAEISLDEVDAAKVKTGQKATLTFDAVEGLSISGEVSEVDMIGTVSQGVVTYNVKIIFDTQDERIKSGMSVSANIITDVKQDALMVPNSAVKSRGEAQYVEILNDALAATDNNGVTSVAPPRQQTVEIGLFNDTSTEIISGLKDGDNVITRTIDTAAAQAAKTQTPSLFGGGSGGGGAMRALH